MANNEKLSCNQFTKADVNSDSIKKTIFANVGFIGAGNMATAIREGLIKSGTLKPSQIFVSAPSENNLAHWKTLGTNTTLKNSDIVFNCPIVILAVKPQFAAEAIASAFSEFRQCPFDSITVVSVLLGVSCNALKDMIKKCVPNTASAKKINIFRTMPNTPLLVGEGCTVLCFKADDREEPEIFQQQKDAVEAIFSCSGLCIEVNEKLISPIGALSGSGPAYVYQIMEALSDGAVKLGVPRDLSYTLTAQTLIGAAKMVLSTGKHPGQLKDEVCSPGGSSIVGISTMEKNGIRYGLIQAVEAAYQRSEEVASMQPKQN